MARQPPERFNLLNLFYFLIKHQNLNENISQMQNFLLVCVCNSMSKQPDIRSTRDPQNHVLPSVDITLLSVNDGPVVSSESIFFVSVFA